MAPDAALRMAVYQEGQRSFNSGAPCPYVDWRAKTWAKGRAAAVEYFTRVAAVEEVTSPSQRRDAQGRLLPLMLSELVRAAQAALSEHGDLPVALRTWHAGENCDQERTDAVSAIPTVQEEIEAVEDYWGGRFTKIFEIEGVD